MKRAALLCAVGVLLSLALSSCGSSTASVQGYVVDYGAAAPIGTTTTTLPLAGMTATVQAKSAGKVVAVQKVPPGGQFHFVLPPGTYTFRVIEYMFCDGHVTLHSGTTTHINVVCVEP
jgi:hypothetical protein